MVSSMRRSVTVLFVCKRGVEGTFFNFKLFAGCLFRAASFDGLFFLSLFSGFLWTRKQILFAHVVKV